MELLDKRIRQILQESFKITQLTILQEKAYQIITKGQNCKICNPTGSGKTLAFLLPLSQMLFHGAKAIIISPSRELTLQTAEIGNKLFQPQHSTFTCYGGTSTKDDYLKLQGGTPDVVFATPGRLCDLLKNSPEKFSHIYTLIIDEFDKCLSLGFEEEIHKIFQATLPRQIILTSATDNESIPDWLASSSEFLNVQDYSQKSGLISTAYARYQTPAEKMNLLYELLSYFNFTKSMIFVNHHDEIEPLFCFLKRTHLKAVPYYGDLPQERRERAVFELQNDCCHTIIATDLAARGLDIQGLNLIIEYDPSINDTIYTHRKGRTGRWDASGYCITMLSAAESTPCYMKGPDITSKIKANKTKPVPDTPYKAFYLGKGKKQKLRKTDILGALCQQLLIPSANIGKISIFNTYSIIAISADCINTQLTTDKIPIKIKNIKTFIQEAKF